MLCLIGTQWDFICFDMSESNVLGKLRDGKATIILKFNVFYISYRVFFENTHKIQKSYQKCWNDEKPEEMADVKWCLRIGKTKEKERNFKEIEMKTPDTLLGFLEFVHI